MQAKATWGRASLQSQTEHHRNGNDSCLLPWTERHCLRQNGTLSGLTAQIGFAIYF